MAGCPPATILIVDDDPGLLRLVEKSLKREGFNMATARSGREAIEWLSHNDVNLMLLDLKLQDIEGKELINHLATLGRPMPFIIITGQGDERVAVDMMKRGALDYLVKDVQFIEFMPTVVRRALEQVERDKRLVAAQSALKESQGQLLAISEREQRQFGAELHDGLGQQLTAIEMRSQALKEDLPTDRPDLRKQVSEICQYLRESIAQTRSLARGLAPVILTGGFMEALDELAGRMSRKGRIKCVFECASPVLVGDTLVANHLFRIAQEAVNNAVKHSGAAEIVLRLTRKDGFLRLEIADNGRGLPEMPSDQGIGLSIMKQRASAIGADLWVESKPGKGVKIVCTLKPKKP